MENKLLRNLAWLKKKIKNNSTEQFPVSLYIIAKKEEYIIFHPLMNVKF